MQYKKYALMRRTRSSTNHLQKIFNKNVISLISIKNKHLALYQLNVRKNLKGLA